MSSIDLVTLAGYALASWVTGWGCGFILFTFRKLTDKL